MSTEAQITNIVNEILKVESIEEAFSCFLVQKPDHAAQKLNTFLQELQAAFVGPSDGDNSMKLPSDQDNMKLASDQEIGLKQYLNLAVTMTNPSRLHVLFSLLEALVSNNTLPARLVCQCILANDKLVYYNECFWVECFCLIKKILPKVNYKGVREIMKGCCEKAKTLPEHLNAAVMNQMKAVESVLEIIFDRNNSLLPAYFIVNEIQKDDAKGKNWPHWKLAKLFSNFVESFRPLAQMVSIIGHCKMLPVIAPSGLADHLIHPCKLDPVTLKLSLKGFLPYDKCLLQPQTHLLRHILEQPYSNDMVCSLLDLHMQPKQSCAAIESQLVELVMVAMERSETEPPAGSSASEDFTNTHWLWLHLSCQLIYFVLRQFANFSNIVNALHEKLSMRELRKGRDHLMWVLLQFVSGSIQKNTLSNFFPLLNLYDLLYPEKEPLPVPDYTKPCCTHQMAVTCIWIHLLRKAQADCPNIHRPIPNALKAHQEFLVMLSSGGSNLTMAERDYRIALLCNAYSTTQEYFSRPMAALVESIQGTGKGTTATTPLSMSVLDSLTVHSKMSLIHSIVTHVIKLAQSKTNMALAPALVETYSRLLVYTEIESLGIKGFISSLLPTVFKSHSWVILYTLLEMFSYRMHHTQPHYRVQLLSDLHSLAAVPQTNQTQLHLCVESTALRLITGLGSGEVQPQLTRFLNEPKTIVSAESEELNRALVLTLARSMHVTGTGNDPVSGSWCKDLLNTIMQATPHSWGKHTLQFFPPVLSEFYQQNPVPKENKQQLKKAVDEEFRNWASMNNENDIIAHFSVPNAPPLFLCLLWKMILETDRISPIAYKILERIGPRALSSHLRKFCDYLVFEIATSDESHLVNKCVDAINNMIWKYNIVTLDRLVLCVALRSLEGNEAQCFLIIQLLCIKAAEFRNRVSEFVKENSPQHWKQSNWHEKHLAFHRKYPEKCVPEDQSGASSSSYHSLPVYFGNVCLRFLPVFDIVIHRCLELLPTVSKSLETLLERLGSLYKFHDRPVTYLYNTLHYYERMLRTRHQLKLKLVSAIVGNLGDVRGWTLSEPYINYMQTQPEKWVPPLDFYINLIQRIVDTMSGSAQFPATDWRFNEFPNPAAQALFVTCVELMALPVPPNVVATSLLDVITRGYTEIGRNNMEAWVNSVGLVMAALPDSYWCVLNERLAELMASLENEKDQDPFHLFNFHRVHNTLTPNKYAYTLATVHAVWHHAGPGQISTIPQFVREKLSPMVKTEEQMIFLCHLVGPFLQRFNVDGVIKGLIDLSIELYKALDQVDKNVRNLQYMNPICDLLYHIKYMFVGDHMKSEAEGIIRKLRPALQKQLRFITNLSIEELEANKDNSNQPQ